MVNRHLTKLIVCGLGVIATTGCDQSKSNMGEQPKAKPDADAAYFADGASARPVVAGTVARNDAVFVQGASIPFDVTRERLERGQTAFDISCSACHGRLGNGDGMIARRGLTRPPSFHVSRLRTASDGHFFGVISNGYGAMFGYSDRVPVETRWEIVAYVRALQAAGEATNLSDADRAILLVGGDPNGRTASSTSEPSEASR